MIKSTFTWTIDNFTFCPELPGEDILSASFLSGNSEWRLKLSPRGKDERFDKYVSLYLQLVDSQNEEVRAGFKFSIVNVAQDDISIRGFTGANHFTKGCSWGYDAFIPREVLFDESKELLPEDKLTIRCQLGIVVGYASTSWENSKIPFDVPDTRLHRDLGNLLGRKELSDVVINVNGLDFHAHKAILAARCSVFGAMFMHDVEENNANRVQVTDVDPNVFRELLCFIYTDLAPNLHEIAEELLVAADKYGLERLKAMCEQALCSRIAVETAAQFLGFADMYNAERLKVHTIQFIRTHCSGVLGTESWKSLIEKQPNLAVEALQVVISKLGPCNEPPCKRMKNE